MSHFEPPLSVVLLAHNEAASIEEVVRGFHAVTARLPGSEIVVAEDGSTDGTREILTRLAGEIPELRLDSSGARRGYVAAYLAAMQLVRNDWIVFCDTSAKHDPEDVWKLLKLAPSHDLVVGYKEYRADPHYRILLAFFFNLLTRWYFGVPFHDIDCPLRLMRKSSFDEVARLPFRERALINFEVAVRFHGYGFPVAETPVTHKPRLSGPSRGLPLARIPRVIWNVLRNLPKIKSDLSRRPR